MSKRSISAKALVGDIRNGLSDAEVMGRHELSYGQLQKIFAQLVKAGFVGQEVLDARRQEETKTSPLGFGVTDVPVTATESRSSEPSRPVPLEPHSFGLSDRESPSPGGAKSSSPSLPLSSEEASRVRRNGLILILTSYVLWTMGTILSGLAERGQLGPFLPDDVAFAFISLVMIGFLITAILGCLRRVRGLGHHPFWAIVAPCPVVNLVVVEALSNRYEQDSDRRGLRVTFATLGVLAWWIAVLLIIKSIKGV